MILKRKSMMSLDKEKVKNFILETTVIQHNRTIEQELLYQRRSGLVCALGLLLMFFWTAFFSDYASISWVVILILTALMSIIVNIRSFKRLDNKLINWKVLEDGISYPRYRGYSSSAGGIGAIIGILIIRNVNISDDTIMAVVPVILVPATILLSHMFGEGHYKLQLLWKYCPEIKDIKAVDFKK